MRTSSEQLAVQDVLPVADRDRRFVRSAHRTCVSCGSTPLVPCPALLPSIPRLLLAVDASKLLAQLALPTSNNGDADGPADVVVIVRTTGQVHVPAPAAPRRLGARLVRVPSPPAPLATQALISLFSTFLSALAPTLPRAEPGSPSPEAHVLSVASRLPVASRKYELVRGLAERLLDDNVSARAGAVNWSELAGAFSRTLRRNGGPPGWC
jgi:hypothetical protein